MKKAARRITASACGSRKGAETVEFLLCFECDSLQVMRNGEPVQKDFAPAHAALVRAIQAVFPSDNAIKKLTLYSQPK